MHAGMTDIAALYKDFAYKSAVDELWSNVVNKKMYITGGIGSKHDGEAFGENYELPNLTAYNETCADIANVYWNYRIFLLHGHSKYIDVLERSLYNGVISGVGLDGKTFFYPNPPSNLCRFMPSVPGYIYAQTENSLYINLFVQSATSSTVGNSKVDIETKTNYRDGNVEFRINPSKKTRFSLHVRIPG